MKYVTRPRLRWNDELECEVSDMQTITVIESEPGYEETGLVDKTGEPLYRRVDMNPIGFRR